MADNPFNKLYALTSQAGIRRDGTALDDNYYADGVWVRWQRGRARKIGGYRAMSTAANGPVRSILVDSRNGINSAHYFSQYGIQRQQFSLSGAAGSVDDRTPVGYYGGGGNPLLTWSHGVMTSSTGGTFSALLAASSQDLLDLTSDTGGGVFTGDIAGTAPLTPLSGPSGLLSVSGGVTVLQPFAVIYGSNGLIYNSNANDLSVAGWTPGGSSFCNIANVAGTKFIYGAPVRGGSQSPAGLFWALDSLVRMSFANNTTTLWQYDTLSNPTSIMGKKTVVEHDGKFFWVGTDRFLFYNGVVQELPNQMNCNWFFDNLNYAQRNKVWGTKIPRFGEIWWFYPRDDATECTDAIIFNYLENTWYDAHKSRSAGGLVQIFPYPIWSGSEDTQTSTVLTLGVALPLSVAGGGGSATLVFASTTGVQDGMVVYSTATGMPTGATVLSHTGTNVVMSAVATGVIPVGTVITFSSMTSVITNGYVVTGVTSGAIGTVVRASVLTLNLISVSGTFAASENLTATPSGVAKSVAATYLQQLDSIYQQEFGVDKIVGSNVTAVLSSFTSTQFGFATGNPFVQTPETIDVMTKVMRLEMDFNQKGPLSISILGASFAQQEQELIQMETLAEDTFYCDFRAQERQISIKVESNVIGGWYEQGQVLVSLVPGDVRSSKVTP